MNESLDFYVCSLEYNYESMKVIFLFGGKKGMDVLKAKTNLIVWKRKEAIHIANGSLTAILANRSDLLGIF